MAGGAAFYFYQKTPIYFQKAEPEVAAHKEVLDLVAEVGKLIVLPEGEIPTAATVSDPEILKDQPFFKNAKVGDKVLIYTNAKKAYLYDPAAHKLIEVAPLNLAAPSSEQLP